MPVGSARAQNACARCGNSKDRFAGPATHRSAHSRLSHGALAAADTVRYDGRMMREPPLPSKNTGIRKMIVDAGGRLWYMGSHNGRLASSCLSVLAIHAKYRYCRYDTLVAQAPRLQSTSDALLRRSLQLVQV